MMMDDDLGNDPRGCGPTRSSKQFPLFEFSQNLLSTPSFSIASISALCSFFTVSAMALDLKPQI